MNKPNHTLSGLRVLDLTRVLAGPLCTMILGDMGADIIKVERPGSGDETRGWGPPFDDRGESAYFLSINRNKLGLAADLASGQDRDLVIGLMADADVVVENYLPGALAKLGLSPEIMCARYSRLIWCTITGFGDDNPRPGYDFVVQAESGLMAISGEPEGAPMKSGVAMVDILAGKDAAIAILGALHRRERTGQGGRISVSLAATAAAALINAAQNALVSGREAGRWGNAHANLVPYEMFDAADRPIVIAVGSDAQWLMCARALGLDELAEDPSLASNAGRLAARAHVVGAIRDRVRTRRAAEWMDILGRAGVPCGEVRGALEAARAAGGSPLTGMPPSVPGSVRLPPPMLNEHGDAIRRSGWRAFAEVSNPSTRQNTPPVY